MTFVPEHPSARNPSPGELETWRSFLRAHANITRLLENELISHDQLSLAAYDVLVQLSESSQRRLRMTELADAVLLSRSGVTRLVDRLERIGLVSRTKSTDDGRGVVAELTDAGFTRLKKAAVTHMDGISRHFVDRIAAEQLEPFGAVCEQLID